MDAVTEVKASIDGRIAELRDEIERLEAAGAALVGPEVAERRATPAPRKTRRVRTRASVAPALAREGRTPSGATRDAVLDALAAIKTPLTAGEVAARKGLGRATVSTTLSRLARDGQVVKAARGYALKG